MTMCDSDKLEREIWKEENAIMILYYKKAIFFVLF